MLGLFYPNRAPAATISGGSWLAARPVTKVASDDLTDVARSTDATTASTKIRLDLGAAYPLRAVALAYTNLSDAATWVIKLGTSAGAGDVLTTAALPAWSLATETALAAIGANEGGLYYLRRFHNIYVHTASLSARYVTIELTDTANAAGYVDVGRAFVAGGYVPTVDAEIGGSDGIVSLSTLAQAESGAQWANSRRRLRRTSINLPERTQAEADILHDLMRYADTTEEVLYVTDTADMAKSQRYGFIGRLKELSPIQQPRYAVRSLGLSITEIA